MTLFHLFPQNVFPNYKKALKKCDSLWFHQSCSCVKAEGQAKLEKVYIRLTYCCFRDMILNLRASSNFLSLLAITLDDCPGRKQECNIRDKEENV